MEESNNATQQQIEQALKNNPDDFNKWIEYVEYFEKQEDKNATKNAYESLLAQYPLLYGYWKRYAELVASLGRLEEAKQIYERGVTTVYSVDLWTYYCVFVAEKSQDLQEIRSLFERAVTSISKDYLGNTLWDKYIQFETSQEEYQKVSSLYVRLLHLPIRNLDNYWLAYQQHVASTSVNELLASAEEREALDRDFAELGTVQMIDDAEQARKSIILNWRRQIYSKTSAELAKRLPFELLIKRPYFHVMPLDENQLNNWRNYLQFEMQQGDTASMTHLFEKCLVSCALYMEFWQRYAHFLESKNEIEKARYNLQKAATIFLKNKPKPYIILAEFEEQHGDINISNQIFYNLVNGIGKGHLESVLHNIYFLTRQKNMDYSIQLFESQREFMDKNNLAFYDIQYIQYLKMIQRESVDFVQLYERAVQSSPQSKLVWLSFIEYEWRNNQVERVLELFERAIQSLTSNTADLIVVLKRYVDVAHLHCSIAKVRQLEHELRQAMMMSVTTTTTNSSSSRDPFAV